MAIYCRVMRAAKRVRDCQLVRRRDNKRNIYTYVHAYSHNRVYSLLTDQVTDGREQMNN
jgi:hypothetical protein